MRAIIWGWTVVLCLYGISSFAQEQLPVVFPNGDFEATTPVQGLNGETRIMPADCTFYTGFTTGGGFGDAAAILVSDENEKRPGSPGARSVHIMHPPSRFPTRYQSHFAQVAVGPDLLTGMTFDIEVWMRTDNWWNSTSHYVQAWIIPVDAEGVPLGDANALDPLVIFIGPYPDDVKSQVQNRLAGTTEWTLYRLENIEIIEPDTYGFYFQVSAWYNNTDTGNRVPGDPGEVTGEAHLWVDDLRLVVPSGSDQTDVNGWMLY